MNELARVSQGWVKIPDVDIGDVQSDVQAKMEIPVGFPKDQKKTYERNREILQVLGYRKRLIFIFDIVTTSRFLDIRNRRKKRLRIHNRFFLGAYAAIARRLMYGFTEEVAVSFRG